MSKRHERLLFRYSAALERGDFETVGAVLREAERDPALEAKLLQLNDAYAAEQSARFDHSNPKEYPMIAALYQNHKSTPARASRRAYSLSFVAALAVVALVGIILATRLADSNIWNSAQRGSPEATVLQLVPAECALTGNDESTLDLYSRPSADALVIHQYVALYVPASALRQLDAAEAEGQTWYYVDISDRGTTVRGWVTAEVYNRSVRCAPLVNALILTQVAGEVALTSTPVPFSVEATSFPPTEVPPNQQALATATPIPSNQQALPTFTPSPYNEESLLRTGEAIGAEATALPPTLVPPGELALATATPFPLDPSAPTLPPTLVPPLATATPLQLVPATPTLSPAALPAAASDLPDFPVYFVREGDTLMSILRMFNFDESMLDDLRIYNRLSADAVLTPGQALVIPVNMPDLVTTCVVHPEQTLALLLQPAESNTPIVTTLPAGSSLEIIGESQQDDGLWVSVRAHIQDITINGVWVRVDTLDFVTDCRTDFAATASQAQALPLPTELPPTLIPPLATATPLPSMTPTPGQ